MQVFVSPSQNEQGSRGTIPLEPHKQERRGEDHPLQRLGEDGAVVAVHHAEERPRGHVERGLHLVLPHGRRPWTRRRRAECVTRPNYYPRGNGSVLASHTELCPNEQSDGQNRGPCRVTDGSRRCWSGRSLHRMGRLLARHRTGCVLPPSPRTLAVSTRTHSNRPC